MQPPHNSMARRLWALGLVLLWAHVAGGQTTATTWTAPDLTSRRSPRFTYLGCFQDNNSSYAIRRMARRLAVWPDMNPAQCAARADTFGYTLFGITPYEDDPRFGWTCWGGFDEAAARSLGRTSPCNGWCSATTCGVHWKLALWRLDNRTYDQGIGGRWQVMTELPIAGVHGMQVTGRDEFLFIDFISGEHPPSWNRTYNLVTWERSSNTWQAVPWFNNTLKDAGCGQWLRQPDGELHGFAGHFGIGTFAMDQRGNNLFRRHRRDVESITPPLAFGRWYGGVVTLPSGRLYVAGGTEDYIKATGSEIWDPAMRLFLNRKGLNGTNVGAYPINDDLFRPSYGGYFPCLTVMPDGSLLYAQSVLVQTMNMVTGLRIAQTPPLPIQSFWEYGVSAAVHTLQMPVYVPGQSAAWSVDWVVFGGHWQATPVKPCRDFSLRTRLTIDGSRHTFSPWTVETMPGPRCQNDAILLPNGRVIVLNGGETGMGQLETTINNTMNNYHTDEAWVYDPDAPVGARYRRTGAMSTIFRAYHGQAVLTSHGDIVVSGTTVARNFRYYKWAYAVTPYQFSEFRIELFTPSYILGPRPAWGWTPTTLEYGGDVVVTLAANTSAASITRVVLMEPGTTTHSLTEATRSQQLAFRVVNSSVLQVTAPANTFVAPPGFYMLFLVAADLSYSVGRWVQLRGPWFEPPTTLRTTGTDLIWTATNNFEEDWNPVWLRVVSGEASVERTRAARGSGEWGLTVTPRNSTVVLASAWPFSMWTGTRLHTHVWARTAAPGATITLELGNENATQAVAAVPWPAAATVSGRMSSTYELFPLGGLVPPLGTYTVRLVLRGLVVGVPVELDDVETYTIHSGADVGVSAETGGSASSSGVPAATRRLLNDPGTRPVPGHDAGSGAAGSDEPSYFGDATATPRGTRARGPRPVQGNPLEGVVMGDTHSQMMAIDRQVQQVQQQQQRQRKRRKQRAQVHHKPGTYGAWSGPPS